MERRRVFMPLSEPHERPRWIIRLLPEEGAVFSSRERAPFLVYVETIQGGVGTCAAPDGADTEAVWARVSAAASGADGVARHRSTSTGSATGTHGQGQDAAAAAAQDRVTSVFRESHAARVRRFARASPFSHLPGWGVDALIVKAGDDMRQEELALQAIDTAHRIWRDAGVPAFVLPYRAVSVAVGGGVMELVRDSMSLDSLKKAASVTTLPQLFQRAYGDGTPERAAAQRNFIESMAGYSALCYLLQLKDRHNGNLMLLRSGHLAHIDFGFLLGTSPGGIGFESAPFKLSQELMETIGGVGSPGFQLFVLLLYQAVMAIRARADEFVTPIQILAAVPSPLPCFGNEAAAVAAVDGLRSRLALHITDDVQAARHIRGLLDASLNNWRTTRYDQFQTWQNGII
jgi:phosphatidylinositol 4-kinase